MKIGTFHHKHLSEQQPDTFTYDRSSSALAMRHKYTKQLSLQHVPSPVLDHLKGSMGYTEL